MSYDVPRDSSPAPLALDATVIRWSSEPAADRPLLVLLHGYGADEHDLFALVPYLQPEFAVAAVRAPLAPPFPMPGYSWYPIEGLDGRDMRHVTDAASALSAWLDTLVTPPASIGLLGFSQGGAVALQAMRLEPDRYSFAVNLSGYVAPGRLETDAALAARRPPVFWGRGTHDDVIPPALVTHTTQWLPEHVDLSGRVYQGLTHSISDAELGDVRAFLQKQLDAR